MSVKSLVCVYVCGCIHVCARMCVHAIHMLGLYICEYACTCECACSHLCVCVCVCTYLMKVKCMYRALSDRRARMTACTRLECEGKGEENGRGEKGEGEGLE